MIETKRREIASFSLISLRQCSNRNITLDAVIRSVGLVGMFQLEH
jgi:hypothetical protein